MAERKSIDSIGESLLSQQRARTEKADKRRRKDQKKLMVLGTLVAGQSLVNSSLKRRMTEIKESNKLNMINSKLYHKKIQTAAQLYNPIQEYNITTLEEAYANNDFMKEWSTVSQPVIDKQMKLEGLDKTLSPVDSNNFVNVQSDNTLQTLLNNRNQWTQGIEQFGLTNQQLALGSEADLNVQLTKRAKQAQQNLSGSIFDMPNLKSILTLGRRKKGSTFDSSETADYNPLGGLSTAVTNIGLNKNFVESSRNFKNTSIQWVGKITESEAKNMANAFKDLPRAFDTNDRILSGMPKAFNKLPRKGFFERKQGAGRMQEFIDYVEDEDNALFKQRYTDNANAFYTKLQNQRGFKGEFLTDILQLDPNSKEYKATETILNDAVGSRFLSHMYTIQQTVIDNKGESNRLGIMSGKEDFEINTQSFDSLVRPKIIVGKDKFETTESFNDSTDKGKADAVVDQGGEILNSEMPAATKSTLINRLIEDIPLQMPKDEVRQLITNQQLLGPNQQQATQMSSTRIENLKRDIENKVVTTVDFTGKRQTRPASPNDIADMESQIRRFSEFDLGRLQDPVQGRELKNQMNRLDIQIESLEDRLPQLEQNLPQDKYNAQIEKLEGLRQDKVELNDQMVNPTVDFMTPRAVGKEVSMNAVKEIIQLNKNLTPEQLTFRETYYSRLLKAESDYGNNKNTFNSKRDAIGIAQIIESQALAEVQRRANPDPKINDGNGANTRAFNEQLKKIHGIDLLTITAKDLEIPLVSVAVMEAYTASTPAPIPTDPVKQAVYYVDTYVKYNKEKLIEELGEEKGIAEYNRKRNESIENFLVNNGFRTEWNEYSKNN